jgi:hypothetical protein
MSYQAADKYVLRLPEGMRDRIRKVAEVNRRSMNSEIVYTLEQALPSAQEETAGVAVTTPTEK